MYVTLKGFVAVDPKEVVGNGKTVRKFSIADNRKGADGTTKKTTWYNFTVKPALAEGITKGSFVEISGHLDITTAGVPYINVVKLEKLPTPVKKIKEAAESSAGSKMGEENPAATMEAEEDIAYDHDDGMSF